MDHSEDKRQFMRLVKKHNLNTDEYVYIFPDTLHDDGKSAVHPLMGNQQLVALADH